MNRAAYTPSTDFLSGRFMLYFARLVAAFLFLALLTLPGLVLCLLRPFHPNLVYWVSRSFGWLRPIFGIRVEVQGQEKLDDLGPCVLICNHQNSLDLSVCAPALPKGAVTLGKKSLKWIPVFGLFYWLSGNLMIDRKDSGRAADTLQQAIDRIRSENLKVWVFPEGTRSYGRGLLRFKTGAFRLAQQANVPLIPVCIADTNHLHLSRWDNGRVAIEIMDPIHLDPEQDPREAADEIHQQMAATIARLNTNA